MHISSMQLRETWGDIWDANSMEDLEVSDRCSDEWTRIHKPKVDEWLGQLPAGPVCEMGCGLGQWTRYYARLGRDATGIDIVPEAIKRAQEQAQARGALLARYVVGDARVMPFEDNVFAGVSSFGVVEHFWDKETQQLIDETFRVLVPKGQILISTPNVWSMHTITRPVLQCMGRWNLGLERSFSPRRLAFYLRRAGFRLLQQGILESGTVFGAVLTRRLPLLERISRWLEKRQSLLGFVSYAIGEKP